MTVEAVLRVVRHDPRDDSPGFTGVSDRSKLSVWWRVYGQACGQFNDACPVPQ
jgi:hypothetical protein